MLQRRYCSLLPRHRPQALQPGLNRGTVVLCRPLVFVAPPLNASGTL